MSTNRAHYPQLYILTAADGFTTICDATIPALRREVDRVVPLAPITVDHWRLGTEPTAHGRWVKEGAFSWP